jgi:hypothetical protein
MDSETWVIQACTNLEIHARALTSESAHQEHLSAVQVGLPRFVEPPLDESQHLFHHRVEEGLHHNGEEMVRL